MLGKSQTSASNYFLGINLGWWLPLQKFKFHLSRNTQKYNQCVCIISIDDLFLHYMFSRSVNHLLQSQNLVTL